MRSRPKSSALLMELLIVILFFMIASMILIRVFAAARLQSEKAEMITDSLSEAQNVADRLYVSEEPEILLESLGFSSQDGVWVRDSGKYRMEALIAEERDEAGIFRRQEVRVISEDEMLFSLPCSRRQEVSE